MPLPESSISVICNQIMSFVRTGMNAASNNISLTLGAPAEVEQSDDEHCINLFFYRFEPSGFQSHAYPNDPWRVRMYCLITIFGVEEDSVSAGENELRMLGEVMRLFREKPVSDPVTVNGEDVRLQTVFSPATDEQINQVWSTQGDTALRPSLIYEMALAPVMPSELRAEPPLVGALGSESRAVEAGRYAAFSGSPRPPAVPATRVNVADPLWTPAICWIHNGECENALSLDVDDPSFGSFQAQVWLAGDPGDSVNLIWEIWDNDGWRTVDPPLSATPAGTEINPEAIPPTVPGSFPETLSLPVSIPAGQSAAQGLLYAQRSVVLSPGADPIEVRSNPLLISLYRVTS